MLYYRSEPLSAPLTVIGPVHLQLCATSSAEDTDFIAKLCVVEPGGRITCLTVGSRRCRYWRRPDQPTALEPAGPTAMYIDMGNLAYVFPAGSRVAMCDGLVMR